jgi:hypothetical protein
MPAWVALAVVLAAAATAPRARVIGAVLGVVVLGGFIYATVRIDGNAAYQRPDWRGVATALGPARQPRAIIAYAGTFATQPLSLYLPGTRWSWDGLPPTRGPVTVSEVDVVGNVYQVPVSPLPPGVQLITRRTVGSLAVDRFRLRPAQRLAPAVLMDRAGALLRDASPGGGILLQP